MKKRILALLLLFALVLQPVAASAEPDADSSGIAIADYEIPNDDSLPIRSKYVMLYSEHDGRVLYAKGADVLLEPASTVKLMVGIVAIELFGDNLERQITVTKEHLSGKEGLSIYIEDGEVLTINQLLHMVLMYGANDASLVLARQYEGGLSGFLSLMNEKAEALGCENTHYKNVSGLHEDGATTTLSDMIKIAACAANTRGLTDITSRDIYKINTEGAVERTVITRNHLVSTLRCAYYKTKGVTGLNYGATDEMGHCLLVSAKYNGKSYYIAEMGGDEYYPEDEDDNELTVPDKDKPKHSSVYDDAIYLLNYAQTAFGYIDILKQGVAISQVNVRFNSTTDFVTLVPSSTVTVFLPLNTNTEKEITYKNIVYDDCLDAPVAEGKTAGQTVIFYNDKELCRVPLITTASVSQNRILYILDRIEISVKSPVFISSVCAFVVLLIIYVLIEAAVRGRRKKKRRKLR